MRVSNFQVIYVEVKTGFNLKKVCFEFKKKKVLVPSRKKDIRIEKVSFEIQKLFLFPNIIRF